MRLNLDLLPENSPVKVNRVGVILTTSYTECRFVKIWVKTKAESMERVQLCVVVLLSLFPLGTGVFSLTEG